MTPQRLRQRVVRGLSGKPSALRSVACRLHSISTASLGLASAHGYSTRSQVGLRQATYPISIQKLSADNSLHRAPLLNPSSHGSLSPHRLGPMPVEATCRCTDRGIWVKVTGWTSVADTSCPRTTRCASLPDRTARPIGHQFLDDATTRRRSARLPVEIRARCSPQPQSGASGRTLRSKSCPRTTHYVRRLRRPVVRRQLPNLSKPSRAARRFAIETP